MNAINFCKRAGVLLMAAVLVTLLADIKTWGAAKSLVTPSVDKDKDKDKKKSDREKRLEQLTAEQLAEVVILAYGGRPELQLVRTNGVEQGSIKIFADDKEIEGRIMRQFLRKENNDNDLARVDVDLPTEKLSFGFNGFTVWAARDGVSFTPEPDVEKSFIGAVVHNYEALLRYKELGSTVERAGTETLVGLEIEKLDLTHKDGSKTRFFISAKTYRILHLEYELVLQPGTPPTKYRTSYFDFRPVQNTLVPAKETLYENGRLIQEIRITQTKFHDKLNEDLFLKY